MAIYGKINENFVNEKTKINKQNHYGKSKYYGERILKKININNKNLKIHILRIPGVIGKGAHNIF